MLISRSHTYITACASLAFIGFDEPGSISYNLTGPGLGLGLALLAGL